jgi:hypothetical protein
VEIGSRKVGAEIPASKRVGSCHCGVAFRSEPPSAKDKRRTGGYSVRRGRRKSQL